MGEQPQQYILSFCDNINFESIPTHAVIVSQIVTRYLHSMC